MVKGARLKFSCICFVGSSPTLVICLPYTQANVMVHPAIFTVMKTNVLRKALYHHTVPPYRLHSVEVITYGFDPCDLGSIPSGAYDDESTDM